MIKIDTPVRRPTPAAFIAEIRQLDWAIIARDHWGSTFETASFAIYDAVLRPGETAIDCGVNLGHHSYAMARLCGPKGRVFGFEAVPALLDKAKNHCSGFDNFTWINKAVLDKPGTAQFNYFPVEHGWSSLKAKADVLGVEEFTVEVTTIDLEVDQPVALMKLDIEGAEFPALKGARRIMSEHAPVVVFESGRSVSAKDFGYTRDEFFDFFDSLEYQVYFISGMPLAIELWDDPTHPWQFVAVHRRSPRLPRVMAAVSSLLDNAAYAFSVGASGPLPDFTNS